MPTHGWARAPPGPGRLRREADCETLANDPPRRKLRIARARGGWLALIVLCLGAPRPGPHCPSLRTTDVGVRARYADPDPFAMQLLEVGGLRNLDTARGRTRAHSSSRPLASPGAVSRFKEIGPGRQLAYIAIWDIMRTQRWALGER